MEPAPLSIRWAIILASLALAVVIIVGGTWWQMRAMGPRRERETRPSAIVIGVGWMCVAAVGLFGAAGLGGRVLERGAGQILPWGALVGFFFASAILMLAFEARVRIRHDETGLDWRGRLGRNRRTPWSDVDYATYSGWSQTVVFRLRSGRQIVVSELSEGLEDLIDAAAAAGVNGIRRPASRR